MNKKMRYKLLRWNEKASQSLVMPVILVLVLAGSTSMVIGIRENTFTNTVANDTVSLENLALQIEKQLDSSGSTSSGSKEWYTSPSDVNKIGFKFSEVLDEDIGSSSGGYEATYCIDDLVISNLTLHQVASVAGTAEEDDSGDINEPTPGGITPRDGGITPGDGATGDSTPSDGSDSSGSESDSSSSSGSDSGETQYYATFDVSLNDDEFANPVDNEGVYYEIQITPLVIANDGTSIISTACLDNGTYEKAIVEGAYSGEESVYGEIKDNVSISTERFSIPSNANKVILVASIAPLPYGAVGDSNWHNNTLRIEVTLNSSSSPDNKRPSIGRVEGPRYIILIENSALVDMVPKILRDTLVWDESVGVGIGGCANSPYTASAIDPDNDPIQIRFDWDAGNSTDPDFPGNDPSDWSDWIEMPSDSVVSVTMWHTWCKPGNYTVRAQARDIHMAKSSWSDPLNVTVVHVEPDLPTIIDHFYGAVRWPIAQFEERYFPPPGGSASNSGVSSSQSSQNANQQEDSSSSQQSQQNDAQSNYNAGMNGFTGVSVGGGVDGGGVDGGDTPLKCFPAGIKITMADGTLKNIEDIKVGDRILAYDIEQHKIVSTIATYVKELVRTGIYDINDGLISVTDDHPFYVRKATGVKTWAAINPERSNLFYPYRKAAQLEIGDELLTIKGKWIKINSITQRTEKTKVYTFSVLSKAHNYFANGILVSNAKYIIDDDTTVETGTNSGQYSIYDVRKIAAFKTLSVSKIRELLSIPDGVKINIQVKVNGITICNYPVVSIDSLKNTAVRTRNILLYYPENYIGASSSAQILYGQLKIIVGI